jgi:hypothetical protein
MERIPNEILAHIFKLVTNLADIGAIRATCRPFRALMDQILGGSNGRLARMINGWQPNAFYGALAIMGDRCFTIIDISHLSGFIELFRPRWGQWRPLMAKALLNGLGEDALVEGLDIMVDLESNVGLITAGRYLKIAELAIIFAQGCPNILPRICEVINGYDDMEQIWNICEVRAIIEYHLGRMWPNVWDLFCKWATLDIGDNLYEHVSYIVHRINTHDNVQEHTMAPIAILVDKLWPKILDDEEACNNGWIDMEFLYKWAPNTIILRNNSRPDDYWLAAHRVNNGHCSD